MKIKTALLALVLTIGFSFENCSFIDQCNCPPFMGDFFNIQGIDLDQYKKDRDCCADKMAENEQVTFAQYHGMIIDFEVEYHSYNDKKQTDGAFSLMPSAWACSCLDNGWKGSKNEALQSLTVTTLNDFDSEHLANDTINDLLEVNAFGDNTNLDTYVMEHASSLIMFEDIFIKLKKAPVLNTEYKIKVAMGLSTGEVYEIVSKPVKITQ